MQAVKIETSVHRLNQSFADRTHKVWKDFKAQAKIKASNSTRYSVRNKQLPTYPPWVEFSGGKLRVSEGCPLGNLKF